MTEAEIEAIVQERLLARLAETKRVKGIKLAARKFSDAEMVAAQKEGLTMKEAAERFGVVYSAIGHRARALGIRFKRERQKREERGIAHAKAKARAACFVAAVRAGMNNHQAARLLGLSPAYGHTPRVRAALAQMAAE